MRTPGSSRLLTSTFLNSNSSPSFDSLGFFYRAPPTLSSPLLSHTSSVNSLPRPSSLPWIVSFILRLFRIGGLQKYPGSRGSLFPFLKNPSISSLIPLFVPFLPDSHLSSSQMSSPQSVHLDGLDLFPPLPNELNLSILRFCSPRTLASFCSSSYSMLEMASPFLYRHLEVHDDVDHLHALFSSRVSLSISF